MYKCFRIAVVLMLFLIKLSRPDISYTVRELAKVNFGATQEHFKQMLRTVKFVLDAGQKTLKLKLMENKKDDKLWDLYSYSNRNNAGNEETRVSVSGFVYL